MSASLVGSEMCIRDRCLWRGPGRLGAGARPISARAGRRQRGPRDGRGRRGRGQGGGDLHRERQAGGGGAPRLRR
eukprot:2817762-Alexandrium_andersonii.AAC.1